MKNLISSNSFAKHLASSRGGYSHKTTASTQPPTSVADRLLIGCSSVADRFLTMTSLCHRLAAAILLLFTLSIGNVWGETVSLPSTVLTLPKIGLGEGWGNAQATNYYYNDATNHFTIYLPYAVRMGASAETSPQTWIAVTSGGSNEGTWNAPDNSIFKGHSYYGVKDNNDKNRYDKITKSTGSVHNFRVKNCTKVVALVQLGKKNDEITVKAYEVTNNTAATTASVTGSHTNSSSAAIGIITLDNLDYTKEYVITVHQSTSNSNGKFYELAFYNHAYTVTYSAGEGSGTVPTETDKDPGAKFDLCSASGLSHDGGKSFLGWKDQDDNTYEEGYEYTMPVKNVTLTAQWGTPATKYDITFVSAQGTAPTAINDSKVTLEELSASGFAHKGWIADQDVTVDEAIVTAGTLIANGKVAHVSANTQFTAQWVAVWTVSYYDEGTKLGEEDVENGENPANYATYQMKALSEFVNWYNNVDLADGHLISDISALAISANTQVYGKWTKAYANSVDFDAYIAANESLADNEDNAKAYLDANYYALSNKGSVTFDKNGSSNNGAYRGLKIKKSGRTITWNVEAGKLVLVKAGVMAANGSLTINGGSANTIDGGSTGSGDNFKNHYFYSAVEAQYIFTTSSDAAEVIKAITITNPFTVTYNAEGGDPVSDQTFTGTALTLPSATKGTETFLGWFTAASGGTWIGDAGDSYTPSESVELHAQWEAISSDKRLTALTYQIGAGAATAVGYVDGTYTYNIELPYAQSYAAITVAATLRDAGASIVGGAITQPVAVPGSATFTVKAADNSTQEYTINFTKAPKDGVCLIKANVGNDSFTIDEEASMLSGSTEKNAVKSSSQRYPDEESGLTGWKFNSKGAYLGLVLSGDDKFLAGDVVKAYVTKVADDGVNKKLYVFSNKTTDNLNSVLLASSTDDVAQGLNSVTLPALTEVNKLYLCRGTDGNDYQNYNPYIAYVAVYRPMNPVLKSMTIDGRTVTINEAAKTATCTIPYASDLAALTIVDEVVWNAAAATDAKVVTSNSGNWVIGDNTLKLTDKDGDYTIYTITLSRDVLKHTVSFNTHGGSAVASEEVVHNGYLASAPADPTKEDFLFQYWSLSDGGSEVDVTTIQVDEDKTFHAVWAPDGAIKLLNGSTVNTTDFITGVTAETVEISDVTYDCVKFSGTVSAVNGIKDKTRIIAYNAKTTQTRIQLSLYNTSTSSRTVLVKGVVEGSTDVQDLASITLGNKEQKTPDYIEFNNAANRTIYIFISSSATDVRFLQVKVIESGTALKTAGQAGYSINFNQGRPFGVKEVDHVFEGLTFQVSSDYQPVNSSYTVAKFKSSSAHVTVASPVTMTVTTANDKTYYVGTSSSATTNETAKTGASEFNLTAGTWYINAGASEVQITNISFSAPKCAEPVISSLVNSDVCDGAGYEALDGTATAADGGSFAYQWYSCDDAVKTNPVELTGEDDATYTPSADGFYYVVVTHSLTDYADNVKASDAVKVTTHAGTEIVTPLARVRKTAGADATLTVEATGKNLHYAWKECETIDGSYTDVAGAADNKSLNITVPDGVKYYKVIVTSDCGAAQESIAKVEKFVPVPQATVSTSTTWDFTTCADAEIKLTDGTSPKKGEECLMANIEGVHMDENFHSESLVMSGEYIYRNVTGKPTCAEYMKFITDVEGVVTVTFSGNGSNRLIRVTDANSVQYSTVSSGTGDVHTEEFFVVPGEVELMGMNEAKTETKKYMRFFQIEFFPYNHRRSGVIGNLGTICWPYNVPVANRKGADFFSIDYFNSSHIIFIEEDGELQAGRPYFFQYTEENMLIQNGETHVDDPSNYRGMYGTFTTLSAGSATDAILQGNVMLNNNNLYYAPAGCWLNAYRAYLKWDEVEALAPYVEPAGAPLRRRMYINMEHKTPTDLENIDVLNNLDGNKFIKDGKLYILRNGHLYNAQGVRVQ